MALGKIKADTLEHSTAGSLDTQFVVEGSAKVYARMESTGINQSLNTSGFTDNGTGDYTVTFTSAFTNNVFAGTTSPVGTAARAAQYSNSQTTGIDVDNFVSTSGSRADGTVGFNIHGDLA